MIPLSLLCSRLDTLSSLCLPVAQMPSLTEAFTHRLSPVTLHLCGSGEPRHWALQGVDILTRAEERGRIAFLDLLATLLNPAQEAAGLLYSKGTLLDCVPLAHQTSQLLFFIALFQPDGSSLSWCMGLFLLGFRNLHFYVKLWTPSCFSSLARTIWRAAHPSQFRAEDTLSRHPGGCTFRDWFPAELTAADHNFLSPVPSVLSPPHILLSSLYTTSSSTRILSETVLKALLKSR